MIGSDYSTPPKITTLSSKAMLSAIRPSKGIRLTGTTAATNNDSSPILDDSGASDGEDPVSDASDESRVSDYNRQSRAPTRTSLGGTGRSLPPERASTQRMSTRNSQTTWVDEQALVAQAPTITTGDPLTYAEAMGRPDSAEWVKAMQSELKSLVDNKTASYVKYQYPQNVIGPKWAFTIKKHADGTICCSE